MTPRERLLQTLRGGTADRVPLSLEGFAVPTRAEMDANPDPAWREIACRIFDHTHYWVRVPSYSNRYLVTPPQFIRVVCRERRNGTVRTYSEIMTPKGPLTAITETNPRTQTVWTVKYPCETLEDIEKIRSVRWERPKGLAPPDLSHLPEGFEQRGIVQTSLSSPFVCVAGMMPYQYFLELCATDLPVIRELTAMCLERELDLLEALLAKPGIEYLWIGGCEWLTPPMGSPRLYDELVQPFEAPLIERAHAAGVLCHIHCHGRVRSTLERVIERGGDFFEPVEPPPNGDILFAEAKAMAAGRITLGGNVEARVMEFGSVRDVEAAVQAAFEGGKQRMVLQTSAGPISRISPQLLANYHRLIDLWEAMSEL